MNGTESKCKRNYKRKRCVLKSSGSLLEELQDLGSFGVCRGSFPARALAGIWGARRDSVSVGRK